MMHPDMESFQIFCERKPADCTYDWLNGDICACGQFAKRVGVPNWQDQSAEPHSFWDTINELARQTPHDFGTLAWRVARYRERFPPKGNSYVDPEPFAAELAL